MIVGHPFNPPHLIPLVEISGGDLTAPQVLDWAVAFYLAIGKAPVLMRKEAYGHIANRLTAALFREAVHMVAEGITTVEGIDEVITQGPGLRWALQGPFTTYHLAGGAGGIEHYMRHLGPTQEARWRTLGEPKLTEDLVRAVNQSTSRSLWPDYHWPSSPGCATPGLLNFTVAQRGPACGLFLLRRRLITHTEVLSPTTTTSSCGSNHPTLSVAVPTRISVHRSSSALAGSW